MTEIALAAIVLDVGLILFAVLVVDKLEHAVAYPASMKTTHVVCPRVRTYVDEIEKLGVCGKIYLGGYSYGAVIAWAMASILPADIEVTMVIKKNFVFSN